MTPTVLTVTHAHMEPSVLYFWQQHHTDTSDYSTMIMSCQNHQNAMFARVSN